MGGGTYAVQNSVWSCGGEKEHASVKFRLMDVISRGFFVVLFGVFFFEFGDYEWTDRGDEFLYRQVSFSSGEWRTLRRSSVNVGIRSGWRYIRTSRVVFLDIRR